MTDFPPDPNRIRVGKRARCPNCWPFRATPSTHLVKVAPIIPTASMTGRYIPGVRYFMCGPHARQMARFRTSVGYRARAYRYRRIRGTQPRPTPTVLLSGY